MTVDRVLSEVWVAEGGLAKLKAKLAEFRVVTPLAAVPEARPLSGVMLAENKFLCLGEGEAMFVYSDGSTETYKLW